MRGQNSGAYCNSKDVRGQRMRYREGRVPGYHQYGASREQAVEMAWRVVATVVGPIATWAYLKLPLSRSKAVG